MRETGTWRRTAALLSVGALVLTACGGDDEPDTEATGETSEPDGSESEESTGSEEEPMDIATDFGVTDEPCETNAVNDGNGCIYLGAISDLTEGPFAALAVPITDAQKAFWNRVNEQGGIAGYDVDYETYTRDNKYNPEVHNQVYQEIKPNILALGQTLGSPTTAAILDDLKTNNIVSVPASWTSAWEFEDIILESGNDYCVESMNALDYASDTLPDGVSSVLAVHYPGDYGWDGAAGAKIWATENGVDFNNVEQVPIGAGGTVDAAVGAIVQQQPDVVVLTVAPTETAQIVGGAAAQGYTGRFIGNSPSWNPALLQTAAAEALVGLYWQAGPWQTFDADTPGHQAMRDALGDIQGNDGYTSGWAWSYPLLAALNAAAENGDLTRAGVFEAAKSLTTVDYEGMVPADDVTFGGEPNDQFGRQTVVSTPDAEAAAGVTEIQGFFTGPTVEDYSFTQPCYVQEGFAG